MLKSCYDIATIKINIIRKWQRLFLDFFEEADNEHQF